MTHNIVRGDGQGRVALEIAKRALREGWEVDLFADKVDEEAIQLGARFFPVKLTAISRKIILVKLWDFALSVGKHLKAESGRYDIVLAYGFTLLQPHDVSNAQFCHAAWYRCPAYKGMWRGFVQTVYQNLTTRSNIISEKMAFGKARRIVACSEMTRRELIEIGIPSDRVQVIWNGADPDEFLPVAVDRAALGLPTSGPLALFAGDIRTGRKNLDTVLRALKDVPELSLAVVGNAEESPFPALAESLGISDRVTFLGYRRDVHALMRAVDMFVFPSRYEPFGMVALEAAFCGVPSILAETVGAVEAVRSAALVVSDPDDVASVAAAMQLLTQDPNLRKSLGEKGLALRETCDWETLMARWMSLFEEIVREKARK